MANIQFQGAIYNCSGYAQIRHLFFELSKNHNVKFVPFKSRDNVRLVNDSEFKKLEETKLEKPYINVISGIAPQIRKDENAVYNIAYSMFETFEIPDSWIQFYNEFDEIWVPSEFCRRAFNRKDLKCKIRVINLGVDTKKFIPKGNEKRFFTFLAVGKWIDRKGWDILINAYTTEFIGNYDVRLCIKTDEEKRNNIDLIKEYLTSDRTAIMPKIMVRNQKVDEEVITKFYQEADCYILPSRGEAFGLPFLESMSSGVPVITSDFGGQTDFINEENGWLIKTKKLCHLSERLCRINAAYKGLWFAEPEIEDVRKAMRYAFENKDEVKEKGLKSREDVKNKFSWKSISKIADQRINEILEEIK